MAIGLDRVQLIKRESAALGGDSADDVDYLEPIQAQEDAIESAGLYLQDATNRDEAVWIERNGSDMRFFDVANPAGFTLSVLATGGSGVTQNDFLLDNEPVSVGITYTPTYSSGKVVLEEWKKTAGLLLVKSIAYTYTGNKVTTEIRKVYDVLGLTVVAQVTWTYSYTGSTLTSAVETRDV